MNELKTLKDNTKYVINPDRLGFREFVEIKDLRAEAIKWIKSDLKYYEIKFGSVAHRIINNWKERFNLTDEELK